MTKLNLFMILLLSGLSAVAEGNFCPPATKLVAKDPKGLQKVITALHQLTDVEVYNGSTKIQPSDLLRGLNPLLVDADKKCVEEIQGFKLQILPEISNDLLFDLMSKLPADGRYGFSILSGQFWLAVQKVQAQGMKVGWVLEGPLQVNGVYLVSENTIGVNVVADAPTLQHEYRHYVQSQQFAYRDRFQKYLIERRAQLAYSDECLPRLNKYFNEVDATTEDIPNWNDYLSHALDIVADKELFAVTEFPQLNLLQVNMSYPSQVTQGVVTENSCPKEFRIAAKEILSQLNIDKIKSEVSRLSSRLSVAQTISNTGVECSNGEKSKPCERYRQMLAEADLIRVHLLAELKTHYETRKEIIRSTLKKLPDSDYQLWCGYSGSFRLLAGCEEEEQ